MANKIKTNHIKLELFLLLASAIFVYFSIFPIPEWHNWLFINERFHIFLEISVAVVALILGFLLISKEEKKYGNIYLPLAAGFLYMGIFDILHALTPPGNNFVALHTIANFMGGFCFASIYLSDNKWVNQRIKSKHAFLVVMMLFAPLLSWIFVYENTLPVMIQSRDFTFPALGLNFFAGILFLAAAGRLLFLFHRNQEIELYFFSCVAAFMGLAGIMYLHSSLWGIDWWFWHSLRIVSYMFALGFIIYDHRRMVNNLRLTISEQRKTEAELIKHREHLEDLVKNRTMELEKEVAGRKCYEAALVATKEKFKALFEKAAVGIALVKSDYTPGEKDWLIMANPALQDFLGYSEEELRRISMASFSHPGDMQENTRLLNEIRAGKRDSFEMDKRYIRKDGQTVWGHLTVSSIRNAQGQPDYFISVAQDITTRKRVEEDLQKAHDELERRVEERTAELKTTYKQLLHAEKLGALGKFIANVAHEFKNPLFGIKMTAQELEGNTKLSEEEKRLTGLMVKETDRLFRMLETLRDFYRPSEGIMIPVDVNQTLKEVLEICERDLALNEIRVKKDFAKDMPAVPAVADQMKQVFLNIIANAEDAMLKSGGCLCIQTKAENGKICIVFKDDGCGIAPENMERIFDPFFTTKAVKGTGLGLSVSYEIIKKHGGEILVESTPNKGTTFTIELPYPAEKHSIPELAMAYAE